MAIKSDFYTSRRKFLTAFAALGVSTGLMHNQMLFGEVFGSNKNIDRKLTPNFTSTEISIETIKEAEKLIGLSFTTEERKVLLEDLKGNLSNYSSLRSFNLDYTVFPTTQFIPKQITIDQGNDSLSTNNYSPTVTKLPKSNEEIAYLTISQLAYLIKNRKLTSTRLTKIYLDRLKKLNKILFFTVTLTEELALAQARYADLEISRGKYRGPLHGIPYGLKDLFAVKGYKTTWGVESLKNQEFDHDATIYKKLTEAGAILVAKLAMGSLASGEKWFGGTTRTPWHPDYPSGGSSSGPASATVSGCVGFSIGTETNGSMVSPCNECGVTGLRPTFGRVSRFGSMPISWSFDKITPICRSVEDCALVLEAISGPDKKDLSTINSRFKWNSKNKIKHLRIGYHTKFFEKELMGNPTSPEGIKYRKSLRDKSKTVLNFFNNQGINLIPIDFDIQSEGAGIMLETEASAAFDEMTRTKWGGNLPDSKWPQVFNRYRFMPAVEYLRAAQIRTKLVEDIQKAMQDVDLFIEITWANNWTTNLTGNPIVVVPIGFMNKWPVTITFVGKHFQEQELLSVAKYYQEHTGHHNKHPSL